MNSRATTSPVSTIVVESLASEQSGQWNSYVDGHPDGTIFHTLRWRDALRSIFRHQDTYLVARRGGDVCGVLPLFEVKSLLFGTSIISVPFAVYGGVIADDLEAGGALLDHARMLAEKRGAKYVELRHLHRDYVDLPSTEIYHTFITDVPDSSDGCLKRIPRKARAEVRKAIKRGDLTAEFDTIDVKQLYRLFAINKRQLGSPIFPSSLFWHIEHLLGDDCKIMAVKKDGEVVSAVMSFIYKDMIMPYYSGAILGAERHSASNFMYFKLMEWASERGLSQFDFGRSREGTGAFRFKKHQGFEPTQLHYSYVLNKSEHVPSFNPSNPKFMLAQSVFRRLPLPVAKKIGSWIAKRAPF